VLKKTLKSLNMDRDIETFNNINFMGGKQELKHKSISYDKECVKIWVNSTRCGIINAW
jgi:hypothetical protein